MPISGISPRSCLVSRRPLARRRRVCCVLLQWSNAPLHVLSVELELCFGDVVVELLDGLGIVCALLVGDVLAGEVRRALAFCLVLRDVLAPFESAFAGDDGE